MDSLPIYGDAGMSTKLRLKYPISMLATISSVRTSMFFIPFLNINLYLGISFLNAYMTTTFFSYIRR